MVDFNCFNLLTHTHSGIFLTDLNRKVIFWHHSLEELTGYAPEVVMQWPDVDGFLYLIDQKNQLLDSPATCPLARCMRESCVIEAEYFLHHKEGYRIPVHIKDFPLRDDQGQVVGGAEIISPVQEKTEEKQILDLTEKAYLDELTGIPNRRAMQEELAAAFTEGLLREPIIMLLLDIDRFKAVNDEYGHMIGDHVLKVVAETLQRNLRSRDMISRWGGEEFLILLRDIDINKALEISNRLRVLVQHSDLRCDDHHISVTISGGLYFARPGGSLYEVFQQADRLLYRAKASGRNRIEASSSS